MPDALATIFFTLFSADNKQAWKDRNLEGWKRFLEDEFTFSWRGKRKVVVREKGFELVAFDGGGWDDGYEPKLWNGGW